MEHHHGSLSACGGPSSSQAMLGDAPCSPQLAGVTARHRAVLVDWMLDVAEEFALRGETISLAVDLLDRRLATEEDGTEWLQLLGLSCVWVAAKAEELLAPSALDMISLIDGLYTVGELLHMEQLVIGSSGGGDCALPPCAVPAAAHACAQHAQPLPRPTALALLSHLLHLGHREQLFGLPPPPPGGDAAAAPSCLLCFWDACEAQVAGGGGHHLAASHNGSSHSFSSTATRHPGGGSVHGGGGGCFGLFGHAVGAPDLDDDAMAQEVLSWKIGAASQQCGGGGGSSGALAPRWQPPPATARDCCALLQPVAESRSARLVAPLAASASSSRWGSCHQQALHQAARLATWPHCGVDLSDHMVMGDDEGDDDNGGDGGDVWGGEAELAAARCGGGGGGDAAWRAAWPQPCSGGPADTAGALLARFTPGVSRQDPDPRGQMRLVYMARAVAEACLLDQALVGCAPLQVRRFRLPFPPSLACLLPWRSALPVVVVGGLPCGLLGWVGRWPWSGRRSSPARRGVRLPRGCRWRRAA